MRIIVADDDRIIRTMIRGLLEKEPDLEVVAEASDGEEAVAKSLELEPDLVLMDISMPRLNGIEATARLAGVKPGLAIIALSVHQGQHYVQAMHKAGAKGYVLKNQASTELVPMVRKTMGRTSHLAGR